MQLRFYLALLLLLLLLPIDVDAQCAMCRAVLESEGDQGLAKGVNNGILFLMAVPYILVGGIGYLIYTKWYKKK